MKGMFFLGKYLILVILVLGQLHGYKGCVEKERKALLEFVKYIISITIEEYSDYALPTWTYNTKSDCCRWEGVKCNRTSKRVTEIAFGTLSLKENSLLNLSLLHPFEDIRSLNLSRNNYYYNQSRIVLNPFQMSFSSAIYMKIEFATKHRYDAYAGKNLNLLFGLDLSENELSGNIPTELGGLLELQAFNVSHNKLSGVIPESFSGLKNVESLDLSFNRLQGLIPQGLTELSSLAVFNVSFNNLSGVIPQGKQFNTFDAQSFVGNPLLCGKLTNGNCDGSTFQEPDNGVNNDESQIDMGSFYWSFLAAYVTILLGIFSSLSFDSPWRRFWFYVFDVFMHKAFPVTGLQSWMMVLGDAPALSDSASQLACSKYSP
ncbi:hypothetical protein F2Q68_00045475 [Brassica cretica]|uniref:Leucine-rich repeat-containing N-terminal plant-type domain-containing protein n=1 Tax=Brassica cretica TaxID=69181 RepID=A0A8S9LNH1_BRACR|nr:hypothetical protein F2Q68_00045475 [Brassica cretica]